MLRTVLCTHAAPNTPVDRWRALVDSLAHLLDGFPRIWDGSASTTPLSGPAQASLALRPACLLDLLSGPLSQGFAVAVARLPSSGFSAPDSYRGVSTELLGRDFHPLERCTFMAHPELLTWRWDCFTARARCYWRNSNIRSELVNSLVGIMNDTRFFWRTSVLAEF